MLSQAVSGTCRGVASNLILFSYYASPLSTIAKVRGHGWCPFSWCRAVRCLLASASLSPARTRVEDDGFLRLITTLVSFAARTQPFLH